MATGSPASSAACAARSAERSALPRSTGKPPRAVNSHARNRFSYSSSLAMKRIRRRVMYPVKKMSNRDRCVGATTNAPVRGTLLRPRTRTQKIAFIGVSVTARHAR
jgi:hypothetical protein